MSKRRVATAAVLLALFGAACANNQKPVQVLGESFSRSSAPVTSSSVTSTVPASNTAPLTNDTATTASTDADTTSSSDIPETTVPTTATITVTYQPHDGGQATATLEETGHTTSLDTGTAVFGDLPAGTYTIHVTIEQPGANPSIGTATYINRSRPIELQPGDNALVECDDTGCSTRIL